jgi:MOSC domain-containing protein YiiM
MGQRDGTRRVEWIHTAPAAGAPMVARERVEAIAGIGLEDDRYALGTGHWEAIGRSGDTLTLVEAEELEAVAAEHGFDLPPGSTRRNLTTRGVRLDDLIGRRFRIGSAMVRGVRRCEPCSYLEGLLGQEVLYPLVHRAGIRAEIETSGQIAVGDSISLTED